MFEEQIQCAICQEYMKVVSWKHLLKHNLTLSEYKLLYPTCPIRSNSAIQRKKDSAKLANISRVGVCRTDEVKQKIKESKSKNPVPAWNKGIGCTEEQKQHLSVVRKKKFASGELVHWNIGKHWSEGVKQKISNTLEQQNRIYSKDSKIKRERTIEQKVAGGWIHPSTVRKGFPSNISEQCRQKLRAMSTARNKKRSDDSYETKCKYLQQFGLIVLNSDGYVFNIQCSKCKTQFTRTSSVLTPYRYDMYGGEYCPTCFPPQYGYYSVNFFVQHPERKEQVGILYIALVSGEENFVKVGITNRTAHQRLLSEPYDFEIFLEAKTTIYEAYRLEQEILSSCAEYKYVPKNSFGGKTECFSLSVLDSEMFKLILNNVW